jgi:hypothetical protein
MFLPGQELLSRRNPSVPLSFPDLSARSRLGSQRRPRSADDATGPESFSICLPSPLMRGQNAFSRRITSLMSSSCASALKIS